MFRVQHTCLLNHQPPSNFLHHLPPWTLIDLAIYFISSRRLFCFWAQLTLTWSVSDWLDSFQEDLMAVDWEPNLSKNKQNCGETWRIMILPKGGRIIKFCLNEVEFLKACNPFKKLALGIFLDRTCSIFKVKHLWIRLKLHFQ